ncbi:Shs1 [Kluyveromyces lactis]|nr:Shs1 [Kluyveromyces lactis]
MSASPVSQVFSPSNNGVSVFRRKKEKRGITFSIMLVGASGTGKTTFANNLLESTIFPHRYHQDVPASTNNENVKIIQPTKVVTFNSMNGIPSYMSPFDPASPFLEPGITVTSTALEITTKSSEDIDSATPEKINFFLTDTLGLGENLNNGICFDEIASYLEQQFDSVLAEETRIKRNPRFQDTRVHVALYFIEPTGHGLRELDVEIMKRLSRYTNVLPIVARADSFTPDELTRFKKRIMEDIDRFNVPIYKFEVDENEDDLETIEENKALARLQPFAIICADQRDNATGKYYREYPWGKIDIDNENISDLKLLKRVLFGSHLQEFKDTTQNLLYENYRAEKLASVPAWDIENNEVPDTSIDDENNEGNSSALMKGLTRNSTAPSLSNFASLINTGKFKSQQSLAIPPQSETPSTPRLTGVDEGDESHASISASSQKSTPLNIQTSPERTKLRNISENIPYMLQHERIVARKQKLEELEAQSAKELQKRIQELERKAIELKMKEKLLRQNSHSQSQESIQTNTTKQNSTSGGAYIKKEETYNDLASIISKKE